MEEFYRNWLNLQHQNTVNNETNNAVPNEQTDIQSEIQSEMQSEDTTNIVYESDGMKLIIEKGYHKRQKIFRLQVLIIKNFLCR